VDKFVSRPFTVERNGASIARNCLEYFSGHFRPQDLRIPPY
jgi:hypothetical protein